MTNKDKGTGTQYRANQLKRVPAISCITAYFHCGNCLSDRPADISPAQWVRLEAGFTPAGLQVRCQRCDLNIVHIDFEGQQHPANTAGHDPAVSEGSSRLQ